MSSCLSVDIDVLEEDGVRKAICGYTWPGIEFGEPPSCAYTFFEYVDSVRFGNLTAFLQLESATKGWWFPTLDRGAGALLHFAVDHGRLNMVKYLVEQRHVPINQRDRVKGWTPLHRCAYIAHYHHAPFFEIFEYLLSVGADPSLRAYSQEQGTSSLGTMALDLVVKKGAGWEEGQVRAWLQKLVDKYNKTPKMPEYVYDGPPMGTEAIRILRTWESLPKLYPPASWRPPPPPGYVGSVGIRRHADQPWRAAGEEDGSCVLRAMTKSELESLSC